MSAQHRGRRQRQALCRPLHALPQHTGIEREQPLTLLADSGFFSEHDLNACSVSGITLLMAENREAHSGCAAVQAGARVTPIRDPHHAAGRDAPSHGHAIGQGALRYPQEHRRTGDRYRRASDAHPTVFGAWPRTGERRVGVGVPGVQHQAAGGFEWIRNDHKTTVFPPPSAFLTKRYP